MGNIATVDRDRLADLLNELFPDGLTAESPRGKARLEGSAS
jgi:hypothetical protein